MAKSLYLLENGNKIETTNNITNNKDNKSNIVKTFNQDNESNEDALNALYALTSKSINNKDSSSYMPYSQQNGIDNPLAKNFVNKNTSEKKNSDINKITLEENKIKIKKIKGSRGKNASKIPNNNLEEEKEKTNFNQKDIIIKENQKKSKQKQKSKEYLKENLKDSSKEKKKKSKNTSELVKNSNKQNTKQKNNSKKRQKDSLSDHEEDQQNNKRSFRKRKLEKDSTFDSEQTGNLEKITPISTSNSDNHFLISSSMNLSGSSLSSSSSLSTSPSIKKENDTTMLPIIQNVNQNNKSKCKRKHSAFTYPPLNMKTIEQRNTISHDLPPKSSRPLGIPEAPTFRPTIEEFKDPYDYIASIAEIGKLYGIVKIIPPESWSPNFAIDPEKFSFRTRRQELNAMEGKSRVTMNFIDQLLKFHAKNGTTFSRFPKINHRKVNLYHFFKAVEAREGYVSCCKEKKWAEVGRELGYYSKTLSSLSTSLRRCYFKILYPYERYLKQAKPAVKQQLLEENAGIFSTPQTSSTSSESSDYKKSDSPTSIARSFEKDYSSDSGSSLSLSDEDLEMEGEFLYKENKQSSNDYISSDDSSKPVLLSPKLNKIDSDTVSLDFGGFRQITNSSQEDLAHISKKKKLESRSGATNIQGSNMVFHRPPRTLSSANLSQTGNFQHGQACEVCHLKTNPSKILLCDGCNDAFHLACLSPPLTLIPRFEWYCDKCLVGTGEYGFEDGAVYSLGQFQDKADKFKERYITKKLSSGFPFKNSKKPTEEEIETEFWELTENIEETIEVEYGADVHSTIHGSGFPSIERFPLDPYSTNPWNLNVIPLHPKSLFKYIKSDISGMTVPWVYIGMMFSTFCWHSEDHWSYSINYQHFGATKTWYGVPGQDAENFANAMKKSIPELFEQQPDILFQLVTMLSPKKLMEEGVRCYALDQRAGEFVITFPNAYHSGFNHGFNFNEAVNFAPVDWEPYGREAVQFYKKHKKSPVFSHDELLLTCALESPSIKTCKWLAPALEEIVNRELKYREVVRNLVPKPMEVSNRLPMKEEDFQCAYSKELSFLSQIVVKDDTVFSPSCLDIVNRYYNLEDIVFRLTYSDEELKDLVKNIHEQANLPEKWIEKLKSVLKEQQRPTLKTLKNLLIEGERIQYDILELEDLRNFVDKASKWVDAAQALIARKLQNRRKNENTKLKRKSSLDIKELNFDLNTTSLHTLENFENLIKEYENLAFSSPEITLLVERKKEIEDFMKLARDALDDPEITAEKLKNLCESGHLLNVEIPELGSLEDLILLRDWRSNVAKINYSDNYLNDVKHLLKQTKELKISNMDQMLIKLKYYQAEGDEWTKDATFTLESKPLDLDRLNELYEKSSKVFVDQDLYQKVEECISKVRNVNKKINRILSMTSADYLFKRPTYTDAKALSSSFDGPNKPSEIITLDACLRAVEEWIRNGKRLFGKSNAPLHILKLHLETIDLADSACFNPDDVFNPSVYNNTSLPSFHETPDEGGIFTKPIIKAKPEPEAVAKYFCLCRRPDAGFMVECDFCHEWYHSKCLKISRGRIKKEQFACPVCDWEFPIPREADRPRLEEFRDWIESGSSLPLIPEEYDIAMRVLKNANEFRQVVNLFIKEKSQNGVFSHSQLSEIKFYLRKLEGAQILLSSETNLLRQEAYRLKPTSNIPPPEISDSKATKKQRVTRQQKPLHSSSLCKTKPPIKEQNDIKKSDTKKVDTIKNSEPKRKLSIKKNPPKKASTKKISIINKAPPPAIPLIPTTHSFTTPPVYVNQFEGNFSQIQHGMNPSFPQYQPLAQISPHQMRTDENLRYYNSTYYQPQFSMPMHPPMNNSFPTDSNPAMLQQPIMPNQMVSNQFPVYGYQVPSITPPHSMCQPPQYHVPYMQYCYQQSPNGPYTVLPNPNTAQQSHEYVEQRLPNHNNELN